MSCLKLWAFQWTFSFLWRWLKQLRRRTTALYDPSIILLLNMAGRKNIEFSCVEVLLSQQPLPVAHHIGLTLVKFPTHIGISTLGGIMQVFLS